MDSRIAEKCRIERTANNKQKLIAEHNQARTLKAIKAGHSTVRQIVKATGLGEESVRKACRRLYDAGKVQRDGIVSISGGQAFIYKVTATGR